MSADVKSIYGDDTPINNGRVVVLASRLGGLEMIQYKQDDRIAAGDINDYDKYDDKFLLTTPTG